MNDVNNPEIKVQIQRKRTKTVLSSEDNSRVATIRPVTMSDALEQDGYTLLLEEGNHVAGYCHIPKFWCGDNVVTELEATATNWITGGFIPEYCRRPSFKSTQS